MKKRSKVWVVDDDEGVIFSIRDSLEPAHEVREFGSSESVIAALMNARDDELPHIMIVDFTLSDGQFRNTDVTKALAQRAKIPRIFISGDLDDHKMAIMGRSLNVPVDYCSKPFTKQELQTKVQKMLGLT